MALPLFVIESRRACFAFPFAGPPHDNSRTAGTTAKPWSTVRVLTTIPMGTIHDPSSVLLIVAASSRYLEAFDWLRVQATWRFGPIALESDAFPFTETDYYRDSMGTDLKKQFFAFEKLIDPSELPGIKRLTNGWEADYAAQGHHPEPRPINLDPGYITSAKLVLASTKDHAHRIYLADGIYGEVTLSFREKAWQPMPWTYPDYHRSDYQAFFTACRPLAH